MFNILLNFFKHLNNSILYDDTVDTTIFLSRAVFYFFRSAEYMFIHPPTLIFRINCAIKS